MLALHKKEAPTGEPSPPPMFRRLRLVKSLIVITGLVAINLANVACSVALSVDRRATFKNRYGSEITISGNGATIAGKFYAARDCSTKAVRCTKYGKSFAILVPRTCSTQFPYAWEAVGVRSVFLAPTPHNPYRALLSTTFGGLVAFIYDNKDGVTQLYFDPSRDIGTRSVWHNLDSFDPYRIQFSKVSGDGFFSCQSSRQD